MEKTVDEKIRDKELEKLKLEVKQLKKPFWKKSGFLVPIIILVVTGLLNLDFIKNSLELQRLQQEIKQIELDTLDSAIAKKETLIKEAQKKITLDTEELAKKQNELNDLNKDFKKKQQEYRIKNDELKKNNIILASQNTQLELDKKKLDQDKELWKSEKEKFDQEKQQLIQEVETSRNELSDLNKKLKKSELEIQKGDLIEMLTVDLKGQINTITIKLLNGSYPYTEVEKTDELFKRIEAYKIGEWSVERIVEYGIYKEDFFLKNNFSKLKIIEIESIKDPDKKREQLDEHNRLIAQVLLRTTKIIDLIVEEINKI